MITFLEKFIEQAYKINKNLDNEIRKKLSAWTTTLKKEFELFQKAFEKLEAPVVFCHNDFRGSNILVTEPDEKIVVVDYEYCAYGPRGYDLGYFIREWDKDAFEFKPIEALTDEVITNFVQLYIDGCELIQPGFSKKPKNSLTEIVKETKFGILSSSMFVLAFLAARDTTKERLLTNDKEVFQVRKHFFQHRNLQIFNLLFFSHLSLSLLKDI